MFEKKTVEKEEILNYIPQRPPIVMVDSFYGVQDSYSFSGLTIDSENIFCEKGKFKEPGLIEHVAQSAALRVGFICHQQKTDVPRGFIGAVKNFRITRLPEVGDKLNTIINVEHDFGDISVITAKVLVDEEIIADCEMKIFIMKE
jgi:predicted hotdog family 3-hydroxylacyl-ACP dehydratase